jgi:tetratricopeptide (TPR) repeat protein
MAAVRLLERELEHYPGNVAAVSSLWNLLVVDKDWEGQLGTLEKAVMLHPNDPKLLHLRAQSLFNLGRLEESRASLDRGLAAAPDYPELLLLDANLLSKEGHKDKALARFEEAKAANAKREAVMRSKAPPPAAHGSAP